MATPGLNISIFISGIALWETLTDARSEVRHSAYMYLSC